MKNSDNATKSYNSFGYLPGTIEEKGWLKIKTYNELEKFDIKDIESFLRLKKIKNINNDVEK